MLYVECETEKVLAKTLQIPRRDIMHLGGRSRVLQRLGEKEASKGLVDEDPDSTQPLMLSRYAETCTKNEFGLKMLIDKKRKTT